MNGLNHIYQIENKIVQLENVVLILYILVCKLRGTARQYSRTLFFLVYVNDVSSSIDPDCKLILYANDKNPYFISEKLCTVDNKLSFILKKPKSFCL